MSKKGNENKKANKKPTQQLHTRRLCAFCERRVDILE
jgi:hypothetical protein